MAEEGGKVGSVFVEMTLDGKKFTSQLKEAGDQTKQLGETMKTHLDITDYIAGKFKVLAGVIAAAFTVNKFKSYLEAGMEKAKEMEKSETRLQAIINATGHVQRMTTDEMVNSAKKYAFENAVSVNTVIDGMAKFARYKNIGPEIFDSAVKGALDLGAAMKSPEAGFQMLGRALEDPTRGMMMLRRQGVMFSEEEKERIKQMVQAKDIYGAQAAIIEKIQGTVGGTAKAMADTYEGHMNRMVGAMGIAKKELGEVIVRNEAVIEVIDFVRDHYYENSKAVKSNSDALRGLVKDGILLVIDAVAGLVIALEILNSMWYTVKAAGIVASMAIFQAFKLLLAPLSAAFDMLVALGKMAYNPFKEFEAAQADAYKQTLKDSEKSRAEMEGRLNKLGDLRGKIMGASTKRRAGAEGDDFSGEGSDMSKKGKGAEQALKQAEERFKMQKELDKMALDLMRGQSTLEQNILKERGFESIVIERKRVEDSADLMKIELENQQNYFETEKTLKDAKRALGKMSQEDYDLWLELEEKKNAATILQIKTKQANEEILLQEKELSRLRDLEEQKLKLATQYAEKQLDLKKKQVERDVAGGRMTTKDSLVAKYDIDLKKNEGQVEAAGRDYNKWLGVDETKAAEALEKMNELLLEQQDLLDDLNENLDKYDDAWGGFKKGVLDWADKATNAFDQFKDVGEKAFSGITDALVDFTMTGKANFSDLANSIIKDLLKIAYQKALIGPLANFLFGGNNSSGMMGGLGGLFGGGAAEGEAGLLDLLISDSMGVLSLAHQGTRQMTLSTLPRYHGGLNADEYPAILQRGETVIPRGGAGVAGAPTEVNITVENKSDTQAKKKDKGTTFDGKKYVRNVIIELMTYDYGFQQTMKGGK